MFPALGNRVPRPWELSSQRLGILSLRAMALPAAGNRITSGWQSHYRRLAIALPAAGNSIAKPLGNLSTPTYVSFPDFTRHFFATLPETV
ncbi:MAG: hypothetical protein SOW10_01760, partial [Alloprevotella sp.]|nr:hypothetical protein [Alloprevotella sp.]